VPDREEIDRRIQGFLIYARHGRTHCISQGIAEHAAQNLDFRLKPHGHEIIKGRVASRGKMKGIARIVHGKEDLIKVEPGSILVAITTDPNYMPAMAKAAAFVTDQGGILSHAAILAREMKKPCIVGTGNATKLLKDGDLIELDDATGEVRKI
jgi:pyruvate,water dikinase